ncbi:MAG: IS66 family insertion sequence element accessory protein TnpB [Bacteroidales bacterium]|nr:IS66 family insertion sequence element accessory protein TnpB [Bacteroidales bacterium]
MINLDKIENVYLCNTSTDLRKSTDGLAIIVQTKFKLDLFKPSLFIFCNKAKDKIKILHYDNGFWLYYRRLEKEKFKWPTDQIGIINITFEELKWLVNGHELRLKERKFKDIKRLDLC